MNRAQFRFLHAPMLATSTLGVATAFGQAVATTPASKQPDPLEEVTVTSYRNSIEESLDQKREANAFVDVIDAEDGGKFPDKNVADSLQRVPGIVISRDGRGQPRQYPWPAGGPDTYAAQRKFRRLGRQSRSFAIVHYVLLPSSMIASLEVFKSPEARIDEGGDRRQWQHVCE